MVLYNSKLPKLDSLSPELKEKLLNLSIQLSYITTQDLFNKYRNFITIKNRFSSEYEKYSDLNSVDLTLTSEEYHTLFNTLCVIEDSYEVTSEKYFRTENDGYIAPLAFPQCLLFLKIHYLYISLYKEKEENAKINKTKIEPLDINEDELFFVLDATSWFYTCRRITKLKEYSEAFLKSKEKSMNKTTILNYTLRNATISEDFYINHHDELAIFTNILKKKNKFLSNNSNIKLLNNISEKTLNISQSRREVLEKNQREKSGYLFSKSYTYNDMKEYPDAFDYRMYWLPDKDPEINKRTNIPELSSKSIYYVNSQWLKGFENLEDIDYLKEKLLSSHYYPDPFYRFVDRLSPSSHQFRSLTSWIICHGTIDSNIDLHFWEPNYKENLKHYFADMVSWVKEFASYKLNLEGHDEFLDIPSLRRISKFVNNDIEYDRLKSDFYKDAQYLDYEIYDFLSSNSNNNFSSSLFSPADCNGGYSAYKDYVIYFTELRTLLQLNYLAWSPLERFLLLDDTEVTPEFFVTILFTDDIIREATNFVHNTPGKGQQAFKDIHTFENFAWAVVISYLMKEFKKNDFCVLNDDGSYSFNEELYNERIAAYSDIFNQLKSPELYHYTKKYLVSDEFIQFLNTKNRRFRLTDLSIEDWKDLIEEVKKLEKGSNIAK